MLKRYNDGSKDVTGLTLDGRVRTSYMWWATFSYQTSYVGSELYPSEMLDNQLHELGHQLGKQTGIAPDLASPKSETLARDLQDCYAQGNKK